MQYPRGMDITVTTSNRTYTLTDVAEMTDIWLGVFDCETPGTMAYHWATGATMSLPVPSCEAHALVVDEPEATDVESERACLERDLRAMRSEAESRISAMRSAAEGFETALSHARAQWRVGRILEWSLSKRHHSLVVELRRQCLDFLSPRRFFRGYEATSVGMVDTTQFSDDIPVHLGRYNIEVLRTGQEHCSCSHSDDDIGCIALGTYVCGLCGYLWVELQDGDRDEYTHGRWAHLYDGHVEEMATWKRDLFGSNPRWAHVRYHERKRRDNYLRLLRKLDAMPVSDIKRHYQSDDRNSATVWRNSHIAGLLGFRSTPRGKWPGVRWDAKLNSLVRDYRATFTLADGSRYQGVVTWVPDMTSIPLSRVQVDHVTAELNTLYQDLVIGTGRGMELLKLFTA